MAESIAHMQKIAMPLLEVQTLHRANGLVRSGLTLSDEAFGALSSFILEKLGILYTDRKKYLLEGRLGKRVQALNLESFEEYVHLLKYGKQREQEFEFLCDTVTINETYFFRNVPQLESFERTVVPEFLRNGRQRTIRVWSAASSSGEEAYSLALVYLEKLKPLYPDLRMEVIGTDISSSVLETAEQGLYGKYSLRNLPGFYLQKYFIPEGDRFRLRPEVRDLARFQNMNLVDRQQIQSMKYFDVIYCSNVLIYFDQRTKVQVVADLYNSLNYRGYLFIGFSELLHGISSAFKVVSFPQTTGYRKD